MTRAWLAVVAALLLALLLSRLQYAGLERDMAKVREAHAIALKAISDEALAAQMSASKASDDTAGEVAAADARGHAKLVEANNEIDRLVAARAADRKRLSVAASCTADTSGMPEASSTSGLDHGAGPRLTRVAERHYFDLRRGIAKVTAQLTACQEYVLAVRR